MQSAYPRYAGGPEQWSAVAGRIGAIVRRLAATLDVAGVVPAVPVIAPAVAAIPTVRAGGLIRAGDRRLAFEDAPLLLGGLLFLLDLRLHARQLRERGGGQDGFEHLAAVSGVLRVGQL